MIKLNSKTFRNAYLKAATVRPTVKQISEQEYDVRRADGAYTRVVFVLSGDSLWAQCGCPAGSPTAWNKAPLPCYHIAAALLADNHAPACTAH
jgi:hypothetical protein